MLKRLFDLILATVSLVLLSPIIITTAIVIVIKLGKPVIFSQLRPGLHGRIFKIYKFRTMTDAVDSKGALLPDEVRLTRTGKWIRSLSLDELPQLINVLKGDLSLVGPRPLLPQYLARYNSEQARRHNVKPGITGWAQVNGRNAISWEDKFRLDVWYVDNRTFLLDLKIIFLTFKKVFKSEGISNSGHVTMTEFMGLQDKAKDEVF